MKKSIIAIGAGTFALVTILLCVNTDAKMYQKKKHFDTVNDVLMQLETNEIRTEYRRNERNETDEFQECLSKRKRLTFSQIYFKKIKIKKIEKLTNEEMDSLIEDYNKIQKKLSMPYKPNNIKPVKLNIEGTYPYKNENGDPEKEECVVDLIMVDEGEGMVIDYYLQHESEKKNNEEEHVNAKG